jgi:hypothetical protein
MTPESRVHAVQALGFSARQAAFLTLVALHSGYWLRRQYTHATGTANGKNVQGFLHQIVACGVAVRAQYRADRGHIYHLRDPRVYRAVGIPDDRNRRPVSPARIARKLMLLDVVLSLPTAEWIGTEADKVALCTQRLGVSRADLPRRSWVLEGASAHTTRYFVDKLPVALLGEPPVLHVVYLSVDGSPAPFARFLATHARLLSALPTWGVIVAHPVGVPAHALVEVFRSSTGDSAGWSEVQRQDLERYFVARRAVERNELARLSTAELQAFRAARLAFAEPRLEALFGRWMASGAIRLEASHLCDPLATRGRLVLQPLPHRYEQFGAFAGVV